MDVMLGDAWLIENPLNVSDNGDVSKSQTEVLMRVVESPEIDRRDPKCVMVSFTKA